MPGLAAGTALEVVGEDRELAADEGSFTDSFGELQVHIYRTKG